MVGTFMKRVLSEPPFKPVVGAFGTHRTVVSGQQKRINRELLEAVRPGLRHLATRA
jgi:hypothetical protein